MRKFAATVLVWLATVPFISAQPLPDKIDAILSRPEVAGNNWSILVENDSGSVRYYQRNPTTGRAPASNTKMVTTAAAFALLGTNHFFETRIYLDGTLSGGVLTGNLNLVSEHDMTWNTSVFSGNARRALDFIAGKLKTNGITQVIGNVQCYGVCIYNYGSTDDTRDTANQAIYNAEAATNFVAALQLQGITVSGTPQGRTGFNPPGTLFYTHKSTDLTYNSQPLRLSIACIPLNKVSHNPMSDMLLRHIGYKMSGTDSFSAGRIQVFNWLQNTAGIPTNGMVMNDGSGLSSNNRFSAQQLVSLTRYMIPRFPNWMTTMPVGCVDGTLGSRFCNTAGSGRVRAKTGSLSSAISLSGYIDNPNDNRRYLFSFLANVSNIDQPATRQAIDDCVVLYGGRTLPISPEIISVTNNGTGNGLTISWSNEKFIGTGYRLYSSSNGVDFGAPISLPLTRHSYTDNSVPNGAVRFYRLTVVGSGGESASSRIYGGRAGNINSSLLVVDGNDRWRSHTSRNPAATNHAFAATVGQSISVPLFDTAHHDALIDGTISLTNYTAVVWMLGEESTQDETFSDAEQTLVKQFLDRGGNLFVSGAEIGWDLDRDSGPTASDRLFYSNTLRATLNGNANDDANTYLFAPVGSGIFAGNSNSGFDNGSVLYDVQFPDVLTPTNGSVAAILYSGGRGGAAVVTYHGSLGGGKLVHIGFPFEAITNAFVRTAYMSDVLRFFDLIPTPQFISLQPDLQLQRVHLRWSGSAGSSYRVQYNTNLSQSNWLNLSPDIAATNSIVSTNDVLNGDRFYRVLLVH